MLVRRGRYLEFNRKFNRTKVKFDLFQSGQKLHCSEDGRCSPRMVFSKSEVMESPQLEKGHVSVSWRDATSFLCTQNDSQIVCLGHICVCGSAVRPWCQVRSVGRAHRVRYGLR